MAGCNPNMRALPDPLYGVTIDNASGSTQTRATQQAADLDAMTRMPIARIVLDETNAGAIVDANYWKTNYAKTVDTLLPVAYLMAETIDSYYLKQTAIADIRARVTGQLDAFAEKFDLWEVGNEVNGNWLGSYTDVAAKIAATYDLVKARGKRTALTLWYNAGCGNGPGELSPEAFTDTYVPQRMKDGLDYVLVSFYELDCAGGRPSAATFKTFFQALHSRYPNAKLGFGEIGISDSIQKYDNQHGAGTGLPIATEMVQFYYGLSNTLALSYFVTGNFWWYWAEDCTPRATRPLWATLNTEMGTY